MCWPDAEPEPDPASRVPGALRRVAKVQCPYWPAARFETEVLDHAGDAVVRVRKQLYVRRKNR